MTDKITVSLRVTPEVRTAIEAVAAAERRPIAHWMEIALEGVLVRAGYLKSDGGPLAKAPLPRRL